MNVMIAADGTEASDAAAQTAVDMFGPDAHYAVVSVGTPTPFYAVSPLGVSPAMMMLADPDVPDWEERSRQALTDAADHVNVADVELISTAGAPGPVICELAEQRGTDVIVIGSHERGWLDKLLKPAVGQYVVDHAPCHVLVVREN